jgi:hypothetical protein
VLWGLKCAKSAFWFSIGIMFRYRTDFPSGEFYFSGIFADKKRLPEIIQAALSFLNLNANVEPQFSVK